MKNIFLSVCVFLLALGSYYWGQRVASDQVWTTCYALDASHAAHIISMKLPDDASVEEYKREVDSHHLHFIRDGFIGLGRLHDEPSSAFPFLVGDREFAVQMLSMAMSRYPGIEELELQKQYPEAGKWSRFSNDQVDWFYEGISLTREADHNQANHGDR